MYPIEYATMIIFHKRNLQDVVQLILSCFIMLLALFLFLSWFSELSQMPQHEYLNGRDSKSGTITWYQGKGRYWRNLWGLVTE